MNADSRSVLAQGIDACVGIVRFRKGPEDVPASVLLLVTTLVAGVLVRLGLLALPAADPPGNIVVLTLLYTGIPLLCVHFVLRGAGRPERFLQTATAIFGAQLVLAPAVILVQWLLGYGAKSSLGALGLLLFLVVGIWLIAISARILRSATGWPLFSCVMLALALDALPTLAAWTLYPPALPAAPGVPAAPAAPAPPV